MPMTPGSVEAQHTGGRSGELVAGAFTNTMVEFASQRSLRLCSSVVLQSTLLKHGGWSAVAQVCMTRILAQTLNQLRLVQDFAERFNDRQLLHTKACKSPNTGGRGITRRYCKWVRALARVGKAAATSLRQVRPETVGAIWHTRGPTAAKFHHVRVQAHPISADISTLLKTIQGCLGV